MGKGENALISCLRMMLRPVVKFCLGRSLGLQDLLESAKIVFVEVASDELKRQEGVFSMSRISVLTGVHRKDVARIYADGDTKDFGTKIASRVIGHWQSKKPFCSNSGKAKVLSYIGDDSEFAKLVRSISSDIHPGTVLFELERIGAVDKTKNGLKLQARLYMPKHDPEEGFRMLARDSEDLQMAIMDNVFSSAKKMPNFHAATIYDNIPEEDLPKIRDWFMKHCSAFHAQTRKFLSKFDLDITPRKGKKGGHRVALGMYTRTK